MSKKIRVLQVGRDNWRDNHQLPEVFDWHYLAPDDFLAYVAQFRADKEAIAEGERQIALLQEHSELSTKDKQAYAKAIRDQFPKVPKFSALVLSDTDYSFDLSGVTVLVNPHLVFAPQEATFSGDLQELARRHFFQTYALAETDAFLYKLSKILFPGQSGGKYHVGEFQISPDFQGTIAYEGHSHVCLEGDFGEDYRFLGHYGYNLSYQSVSYQELWPEFIKDETVFIKYRVELIQEGSLANVIQVWEYEEEDFEKQFLIDHSESGYLAISLFAKGKGQLKLGPFHHRWSRAGYGEFVLGGRRYADGKRQEFNYFFDPGDFKPPLRVYFSGWRSAEGFEGYGLMKGMSRSPFMLICDPRLTGGAFYMGTAAFEQHMVSVIREALDFLGFDKSQLILSGMSMGTFGALYYACDLEPAAIVISKPVLSNGRMALWERLDRPGVFPVSLDLLLMHSGKMDAVGAAELDAKFWDKWRQANLSQTTLAVAYMKQDDYDTTAFEDLVRETKGKGVKIIGRGWEGKHNDGSGETVSWFVKQYHQLLKEHFERGVEL